MNFRKQPHARTSQRPGAGLARALSKLGFCSRSQAVMLITNALVRVNGNLRTDPEWRVDLERDKITVDGQPVGSQEKLYVMLNKPRGLVTTASDEQGRETVFECLLGKDLPFMAPVGRLDKASEGLLLFTNDTEWAAHLTSPESHLDKRYHVQMNSLADETLVKRMMAGVTEGSDFLKAKRVTILRHGTRNSWLEIILDEGKNRHIRRLLAALGVEVLRLIRISVGPLELGNLPKGASRNLTEDEVRKLGKRSR